MVKNNVADRRHALELTLVQLSKLSLVPKSTLSDIEKGREPGVMAAKRIAHALETSIDELWPD